jgi:hypothetical protein
MIASEQHHEPPARQEHLLGDERLTRCPDVSRHEISAAREANRLQPVRSCTQTVSMYEEESIRAAAPTARTSRAPARRRKTARTLFPSPWNSSNGDGRDFWSIDVMTCHDRLLSKNFPSLVTAVENVESFVRFCPDCVGE